MNGQKEYFNE